MPPSTGHPRRLSHGEPAGQSPASPGNIGASIGEVNEARLAGDFRDQVAPPLRVLAEEQRFPPGEVCKWEEGGRS